MRQGFVERAQVVRKKARLRGVSPGGEERDKVTWSETWW
jgi:hypothetical protein